MSEPDTPSPREVLAAALVELGRLRNQTGPTIAFKKWRQTVVNAIGALWPEDRAKVSRLLRIPFLPASAKADRMELRRVYDRGCGEAVTHLKGLLAEYDREVAAGQRTPDPASGTAPASPLGSDGLPNLSWLESGAAPAAEAELPPGDMEDLRSVTDEFLSASPVFSVAGPGGAGRTAGPAGGAPQELSPSALAIMAMAVELESLGVPAGERPRVREALLDLAAPVAHDRAVPRSRGVGRRHSPLPRGPLPGAPLCAASRGGAGPQAGAGRSQRCAIVPGVRRGRRGSAMNLDQLTIKSREALERAQRLARERGHQELAPEHLLAALLDEPEGTIAAVLGKLGVQRPPLAQGLEQALARLPKVSGGSMYLGEGLRGVLDRAEGEAQRLKDEFVSVEHLLMALAASETPGAAPQLLQRAGVTPEALYKALADVRGGQRVTDENPEDKYQALARFSRDLTAAARSGKLDPVIGRDDEIRRVVQVLARRTKNNPVLI